MPEVEGTSRRQRLKPLIIGVNVILGLLVPYDASQYGKCLGQLLQVACHAIAMEVLWILVIGGLIDFGLAAV